MIGIDGGVGNSAVERPATGGLIRPACGQPLASKCRVEPTGLFRG